MPTTIALLWFTTLASTAHAGPERSPDASDEPEQPFCPQNGIHYTNAITWTSAQLASRAATYGTSYPDPTDTVDATTAAWCVDHFELSALQAAGTNVMVEAFQGGGHGQTKPSVSSYQPGATFQCGMCGYYPDEEPVEPNFGKGMTWVQKATDATTGVATVGCDGLCDPIDGDTECTTALPLLCTSELNAPAPASGSFSQYYMWSGNVIATTPPVSPLADGLSTISDANAVCASEFGPGWRVAEFHDGWAWNFLAYGNTGASERFWVDIDDQPNGRCWTY